MCLLFLEVVRDAVLDEGSDVGELFVSGSVGLVCGSKQILTSSLSHNNNRMSPSVESFLKVSEESVGAVHLKGNLRNQAEVRLMACDCGSRSDESRLTSHQLQKTDSVNL